MPVTLTHEEPIGIVTIDRPERLNALDLNSFRQLEDIVEQVGRDGRLRSLIITAVGRRAFSVGADINDLSDIHADEASDRAAWRRNVLQKLAELHIPSVAVLDGLVIGGGVELALACTFRFATPQATFSFPEIKLGLLPGAGGTQRLPRLIGLARARKMMLTAEPVGAQQALQIGLVDQIEEDPLHAAKAFGSSFAAFSRAAVAGILAATRAADFPLADGLVREGEELAVLSNSPEALESIAAFRERRESR